MKRETQTGEMERETQRGEMKRETQTGETERETQTGEMEREGMILRMLTDGLGGDQVAEERGEHDQDHGIGDPGQVLEQDVTTQLPMHPRVC